MKVLVITLLALVAVVASRNLNFEDVIDLEENTAYGYHRKYGIPLANEIRETEARGESAKIAGGSAVQLGWFPYQVGLIITFTSGGSPGVCGGSILNSRRVLTAAHCWWDGEKQGRQYSAVAGSLTLFTHTTGQRQTGSAIVMHSSWNPRRRINDIAMINLSFAFSFTNNIKAVALPSGSELNYDYAGSTGTVTGYGRTNDNPGIPQNTVLRSVPANVFANRMCQESVSIVTATHLCTRRTAGMSPCPGDSGGPLVVSSSGRYMVIGVVSFGSSRCTIGDPVVYTRVTSFINWIRSRL